MNITSISAVRSGTFVQLSATVDVIGGVAPITYKWERSTHSDFSSNVQFVESSTSVINRLDTGGSPNTTYWWRLTVTDSTPTSVSSISNSEVYPPIISLVANAFTALNSVVLTNAKPTGGSGPYTTHWYKGTDSSFTPSSGNMIPDDPDGYYRDWDVSDGTTYYYKYVVTDSNGYSSTTGVNAAPTPVQAINGLKPQALCNPHSAPVAGRTVASVQLPRVDWADGISEVTQWKSDVQTSITNAEKRTGLVGKARKSVVYPIKGLDTNSSSLIRQLLRNITVSHVIVPLYQDQSKLLVSATLGSNQFTCPTSERRFQPGMLICLATFKESKLLSDEIEIFQIQSVLGNVVTLTTNLTKDYPAYTRVWPFIECDFTPSSDSSLETSTVITANITFKEAPGYPAILALQDANTIPTGMQSYEGLPIFDFHLSADGATETFNRNAAISNLGFGTSIIGYGNPKYGFKGSVEFLQRTGAWKFKKFFDSRRGQVYPFWMINKSNEYSVKEINTTSIIVSSIGDKQNYAYRNYVAILMRDGTIYIRKLTSIARDARLKRDSLLVDSALPAISLSDVRKVSVANLCRFNTDEISETWTTDGVYKASVEMISIENEKDITVLNIADPRSSGTLTAAACSWVYCNQGPATISLGGSTNDPVLQLIGNFLLQPKDGLNPSAYIVENYTTYPAMYAFKNTPTSSIASGNIVSGRYLRIISGRDQNVTLKFVAPSTPIGSFNRACLIINGSKRSTYIVDKATGPSAASTYGTRSPGSNVWLYSNGTSGISISLNMGDEVIMVYENCPAFSTSLTDCSPYYDYTDLGTVYDPNFLTWTSKYTHDTFVNATSTLKQWTVSGGYCSSTSPYAYFRLDYFNPRWQQTYAQAYVDLYIGTTSWLNYVGPTHRYEVNTALYPGDTSRRNYPATFCLWVEATAGLDWEFSLDMTNLQDESILFSPKQKIYDGSLGKTLDGQVDIRFNFGNLVSKIVTNLGEFSGTDTAKGRGPGKIVIYLNTSAVDSSSYPDYSYLTIPGNWNGDGWPYNDGGLYTGALRREGGEPGGGFAYGRLSFDTNGYKHYKYAKIQTLFPNQGYPRNTSPSTWINKTDLYMGY